MLRGIRPPAFDRPRRTAWWLVVSVGVYLLVWSAIILGVGYIAWHFLQKVW